MPFVLGDDTTLFRTLWMPSLRFHDFPTASSTKATPLRDVFAGRRAASGDGGRSRSCAEPLGLGRREQQLLGMRLPPQRPSPTFPRLLLRKVDTAFRGADP